MSDNTLALRLRTARINARFKSAADAARRLGIGVSTYAAHENGQNSFGPDEAVKYGAVFGVAPQWLLLGLGEESADIVGETIADRIRSSLRHHNLSIREAERRAGLAEGAITNITRSSANADYSPRVDTAIAIATALDVDLAWLATGHGKSEVPSSAPATAELRDRFAWQALSGMLACENEQFAYQPSDAAERAYQFADAMLKAREVRR